MLRMVLSRQKEELSGEPQMVNDEKLWSEISKKDCIEFVKTLQNFNSYVYQEFVHLRKDFKIESDDCIKALKQKVKELFEGRPDLILGFNAFLPKRHRINVPIQVKVQTSRKLPIVLSRKRKRCDDASDVFGSGSNDSKLQKVIDFVSKVKDRFHHHDNEEGEDVFQSFLDIFLTNHRKRNKLSPSKSITAEEDELHIYKKVEELFDGHPDLIDEFTNFLPTVPFPSLSSVIYFDNCETCTPSYRLLPENFPIPAATKRSKLASQVLNDRWVCVPSTTSRGGGGGGTTQQYKSGWEDKRFEVDRKVNTVKSTLKSISALMEKIEKDSPSNIYVEDHLTELDLKCVQRCYKKQGLKAMDELRKDIRGALPLLMRGLKLQEEKLKQRRSSLNQKWVCHMKVLSCR
ncbi:hypothetical protein ACLB2K_049368 [Fragaria x ananassa]